VIRNAVSLQSEKISGERLCFNYSDNISLSSAVVVGKGNVPVSSHNENLVSQNAPPLRVQGRGADSVQLACSGPGPSRRVPLGGSFQPPLGSCCRAGSLPPAGVAGG
jgi:hypothetical protein